MKLFENIICIYQIKVVLLYCQSRQIKINVIMIQTVKYSENSGIWTVTIGKWSKTAYSLEDVQYYVSIFHKGLLNDNK